VRVLIQSSVTSKYLAPSLEWTGDEVAAIDFKKTVRAVEYCVRQRMADAQLVLKFGEAPELDIVLPLRMPSSRSGYLVSPKVKRSGLPAA